MSKVVDFIKAWVVVVNGDPELFESEEEAMSIATNWYTNGVKQLHHDWLFYQPSVI
jgi:hypothetical protein